MQLQIAFDATDPHALARFWASALGYEVEDHTEVVDGLLAAGLIPRDEVLDVVPGDREDGGRRAFRDVAACRGPGPRIFVQRVPEPKAAKNRQHFDLRAVGALGAEVARLRALGATTLRGGADLVVMADPEGNEFCVET